VFFEMLSSRAWCALFAFQAWLSLSFAMTTGEGVGFERMMEGIVGRPRAPSAADLQNDLSEVEAAAPPQAPVLLDAPPTPAEELASLEGEVDAVMQSRHSDSSDAPRSGMSMPAAVASAAAAPQNVLGDVLLEVDAEDSEQAAPALFQMFAVHGHASGHARSRGWGGDQPDALTDLGTAAVQQADEPDATDMEESVLAAGLDDDAPEAPSDPLSPAPVSKKPKAVLARDIVDVEAAKAAFGVTAAPTIALVASARDGGKAGAGTANAQDSGLGFLRKIADGAFKPFAEAEAEASEVVNEAERPSAPSSNTVATSEFG